MPKLSGRGWTAVNDQVVPRLAEWYQARDHLLSPKGRKIVERATSKGALAGQTGCQRLLEPAMLLGLRASADGLFDLAMICQAVPFTGDYAIWDPIRAVHAMAYRGLANADDARANTVELLLSLPENGELPGPPVTSGAMANRLNGMLISTFEYDFVRPLKLPAFSYLIEKLRELMIVWAFGGSTEWSRDRIDQEILKSEGIILDFLANDD